MTRNFKLPIVLFLLLLSLPTFAQKKMDIILFGMPQQAFILGKYDKENRSLQKRKPYLSIAGGLLVRRELHKRWSFNYGIMYSHQVHYYKTYFNGDHKNKIILSYLKIPILFQYNFIHKENFSAFLIAGPQASLLFTQEGAIINSTDIIEVGGAYRSVVMDAVAAIGGEIKIHKNVYYSLQFRFDHSLHYINNLSYKDLSAKGENDIVDVKGHPWSGQYGMTIGLVNALVLRIK